MLEKSVFWTDSTTVLKYITNETKRFHTFVANRTSVIREASDIEQWRYVGSKENPADEASRGMKAQDFLTGGRWLNGPEFLSKPEEEWPNLKGDCDVVSDDDPEVKRDLTVNAIVKDVEKATGQLINYFSSWIRLRTSVAWFLKIKAALMTLAQKRKEFSASAGLNKEQEVDRKVQNFKVTLKGQNLTPGDLVKAEESIILYVQKHKFEAEIASLKSGFKTISKESTLYKLDPVLDDGILRVGGRLNKAALPAESKHHSF